MAKAVAAKLAILFVAVAGLTAAFTMAARVSDLALYNHSPSMPVGLYLRSDAALDRGAIVTVRARDVAPALAAARAFDGTGDRFIKRVAAVAGDQLCAGELVLKINGFGVWPIPAQGQNGTSPTNWRGCRTLGAGEVLLLGDTPNSFDGRYWGPIDARLIEGVWRKL